MGKILQVLLLCGFVCCSTQQKCGSYVDEVENNCICESSYMDCHNLNIMPSFTFKNYTNVIKHLAIRDSSIGTVDKTNIGSNYDTVEILNLENCEIRNLGDKAFANMLRLKKLYLTRNKLTTLTNGMFFGLEELHWLDLSRNLIESLPTGFLESMPQLEGLDLSYNKQLFLDDDFFTGSKLQNVSLHHLGLTSIPTAKLSEIENLQELGLDGNYISSIPAHAFMGFTKLETLALDANNISVIENGAFEGLPKLRFLNLRNNKLTELKMEVMKPIGDTLEVIYLENNLLTTLLPDVIRHDMISEVRLGGNPWVCDCKIKWMKDLDLKHRDPGNVTCDKPSSWKGYVLSDVTTDMLCSWCEGCDKSKLAYAIGIPILLICSCLMAYYIYRLIQSRRQNSRLRKVYKYSNVYKDTVEPVRSTSALPTRRV